MSIQKEWLDFLREQFVEAKSAPRETPCGHSTLRSLASPLPTETAARVSTGAPFGSRIKVRTLGEGAPDALKPGATGSLEHCQRRFEIVKKRRKNFFIFRELSFRKSVKPCETK